MRAVSAIGRDCKAVSVRDGRRSPAAADRGARRLGKAGRAGSDLRPALAAIAAAAAEALGAELVAIRVVGDDGDLVARAVAPQHSVFAAEVAGTRGSSDRFADGLASEAVLRVAAQVGAAVLAVPARTGDRLVGAVEVVRDEPFGETEVAFATLAAAQVGLAVRTLASGAYAADSRRLAWLDLAGEALASGWDAHRTAEQALRIAAAATGARAGSSGASRTTARRAACELGEVRRRCLAP